jgi:rhodanese-related sulfurtransferase
MSVRKGSNAAYHLSPFQNIPLHELKKRSSELDKEKEVVLICQSGMRSQKAARILKNKDFNELQTLKAD